MVVFNETHLSGGNVTPISSRTRNSSSPSIVPTTKRILPALMAVPLILGWIFASSSSGALLGAALASPGDSSAEASAPGAADLPGDETSATGEESDSKGLDKDLERAVVEAVSGVFSEMTDLPILLFPEAKEGALKNLQPVLKEEYFVKPVVKSAALVREPGEKHLYESITTSLDPFLIRGLPLNEVTLSFNGAEFFKKDLLEKKVFTLTKVDCIVLRMACPLEKLSDFITDQAKKYGHLIPKFKSDGEKVLVYGPMKFLEFTGEVNVSGRFEVLPETRDVVYRIEEVKLGDNHVPGFVIETISSIVNPIFRIEDFPYKLSPVRISIEASGKDLVIYGENRNFVHKYKKIEYKSDYLKKFLKN